MNMACSPWITLHYDTVTIQGVPGTTTECPQNSYSPFIQLEFIKKLSGQQAQAVFIV